MIVISARTYIALILSTIIFSRCTGVHEGQEEEILSTQLYPNGNKKIVHYRGKDEGEKCYEYFYKNGNTEKKFCNLNKKLNGVVKFYYENGKLKYENYYEDGIENGWFTSYYENGNLADKVFYQDGKRIGKQYFYNINSKITSIVYLKNDKAYYKKKFNYEEKGYKLISTEEEIAPIIELQKEIFTDKNIDFIFHLPPFEENSQFNRSNFYIIYDFAKVKDSLKNDEFSYPRFRTELIKNDVIQEQGKFREPGVYFLYGVLRYRISNQRDTTISKFKEKFEVSSLHI